MIAKYVVALASKQRMGLDIHHDDAIAVGAAGDRVAMIDKARAPTADDAGRDHDLDLHLLRHVARRRAGLALFAAHRKAGTAAAGTRDLEFAHVGRQVAHVARAAARVARLANGLATAAALARVAQRLADKGNVLRAATHALLPRERERGLERLALAERRGRRGLMG